MKRAWEDGPGAIGAPRKQEINVSVLVPADDPGQYLLRYYPDRGWWLPSGKVAHDEEIQLTAKRIASEVCWQVRRSLHKFSSPLSLPWCSFHLH